jgi:hypothetical protein
MPAPKATARTLRADPQCRRRSAVGQSPAPGNAGASDRRHNPLLRRNIPGSGNENSLFSDVQGIRCKHFKRLHNQPWAGAEAGASGAKFSKYPVKFPDRREFAAAPLAGLFRRCGLMPPHSAAACCLP